MARKSNTKSVKAAEVELAAVMETVVETEETNWMLPTNRIEAAPEADLEVVEEPAEEPEAEPKAEPVNVSWPSIGKYAEHLIQTTDLKNSQIVGLVKQVFPAANTTTSCIAWYRSNLKKPIVRTKKAKAVRPLVGQVCVVDDFGNQM